MNTKRKMKGGVVGIIGFLLSPLSWWNDAFINLPLAVAFGWLVSLFYAPAFEVAVIVGYWLTNVVGLILLHRGTHALVSKQEPITTRKELLKDLAISLIYTAVIVALIRGHLLEPLPHYFGH